MGKPKLIAQLLPIDWAGNVRNAVDTVGAILYRIGTLSEAATPSGNGPPHSSVLELTKAICVAFTVFPGSDMAWVDLLPRASVAQCHQAQGCGHFLV